METVLFYNQGNLMRIRLLVEFIGMLFSLSSADAIQFSLALLFNIAVFNTFNTK